MNCKINFSELERENEKLAQDIDEIQHVLAVHKNGSNTAQRATSSIWGAGGKGPLSGFKSRKSIVDKSNKLKVKEVKNSPEATIPRTKNRQFDDRSKLKVGEKQSQLKSTAEKRGEWKRMQSRRVSFNIDDTPKNELHDGIHEGTNRHSDSVDTTNVVRVSGDDSANVARGPGDDPAHVMSESCHETTEEKIAALKVKVLAKASSKVKLEMKKKKDPDIFKKENKSSQQLQSTNISRSKSATARKSRINLTSKTREKSIDSEITSISCESPNHDFSTFTKDIDILYHATEAPKRGDTGLVGEKKGSGLIGQSHNTDSINEPAPEVIDWLEQFKIQDEDCYQNLIEVITTNNLMPEKLDAMKEKDWIDLGFNDLSCVSHILKGIHKPQVNNNQEFEQTFTKTDHLEKVEDPKKDIDTGNNALKSAKIRTHSATNVTKQHKVTDKKARPSSAINIRSSNHQQKIKRDNVTGSERGSLKSTSIHGAVVIATKTGVPKVSQKLKEKQEQEQEIKKKKMKEALQRKTERDKMAAQHQKRLVEKEKMLHEIKENEDEKDISDLTERTEPKELSLVAQGIALPESYSQSRDVYSVGDCSEPSIHSGDVHGSARSAKHLTGDQLKKIELQVIGLQENLKIGDSSVESNILRLQKQLSDIQRELHAQPVKESSKSEKTSPGKVKKEKKSPDTLHSRTELMREVRKQKEQHRKEIRMLESELSRLKHRDPVKTCELSEEDINFSDKDIIGEGAFSQVFHGKFNGSEVAIKRLKHSLSSSDKNYFAEEVHLLHGLRHPRIVLLIGVCTTGKLPIMVLEYMASGSLHQHLHDRSIPRLDHVSYYRISKDIALGMTYLHRHKPPVLHLDLKSLNILLNAYGRAKIADFGFSKLKHDAEELSGLRGTPAWMAPELLDPAFGELSIKADVYSFGVILWEMLTRETPYKGVGVFQILECIRNSKRPEIPEYCPDPLKGLINRCWKQKPNQRPSFKEILISLEGLQIPLEWRSLLSSAGIPHEVMEDPNSARSIINLINQSVDIPVPQLNELSLQSHDELIKQDHSLADGRDIMAEPAISGNQTMTTTDRAPPPPPLVNLARFIEEQTKRISEPRPVHPAQGVSKCVKSSQNSKPFAVPASELADQKLMLKSTTQGPHPSQLKNLSNITKQKFTSIAEVLRQSVNNRRFAMKMQNDSIDQSTLDSNWSVSST
ncbi:uncharacterized protein LOC117108132 [Anneissia japonica]|uniref:uncharacterized protein LOC117108132 n=1 Tax=Anneissia japonica TaxID=1529436 RepID=UPI001425922D|nr:uncharacterized protein LOC117108132 [Anneissia japonica]